MNEYYSSITEQSFQRNNYCENRSLATLFKPTFETANYEKGSN